MQGVKLQNWRSCWNYAWNNRRNNDQMFEWNIDKVLNITKGFMMLFKMCQKSKSWQNMDKCHFDATNRKSVAVQESYENWREW
jgi:hypothetical protein